MKATIVLTAFGNNCFSLPGACSKSFRASASNTNLFPSANVKLSRFILKNQELKVDLSLVPRAEQSGLSVITVTATDRGGLSASRSFFVTVTPLNAPPVVTAADSLLALRPAVTGGFELELRTAPTNSWKVETSDDLKTWEEYVTTGVVMQAGTNRVNRLHIGATTERQFFRARQIE